MQPSTLFPTDNDFSVIRCSLVSPVPMKMGEPLDFASLGTLGLHVACGGLWLNDWLNTDQFTFVDAVGNSTQEGKLYRIDSGFYYLQQDAQNPFPIPDGLIPRIYAEHFIEHIGFPHGVLWLREMKRILSTGGILRVTTPDLATYANAYNDRRNAFFSEHRKRLEKLGFPNVPERRAWMFNQIFKEWGHQWIYDFEELKYAATQAGFSPEKVKRAHFKEGLDPILSSLDSPERNDETLYVDINK